MGRKTEVTSPRTLDTGEGGRGLMTQVFDGITVLDFSQGMAGSVATMVMSDFGADVIKVEPPGGDPYRTHPASLLWNRGKKSVVLDLETVEGRKHARALARSADAVVESFVPGDAAALGVDYDTLKAENPGLVYTSITAFGDSGPYARYRPYEALVSAKCGRYMAFAGQNGREGPNYGAVQVASHGAAMAAVRGAVAALMIRDRTGVGQRVQTSLLRAMTYYDLSQFLVWQMMIKFPENFPDDLTVVASRPAPIQYLAVRAGDGRWMQLANLVERLFISEIHAIGLGHLLENPRYASAPFLDDDPREEMRGFILDKMQEKSLDEWMDLFVNVEGDVAAEPVMTSIEALDHPQLVYNGSVQTVHDPTVGPMRQLGPLFRMDAAQPSVQGPAPQIGQHTDEVLSRIGNPPAQSANGNGATPAHPLEGVTVLDMSTVIAGPLAGSLLAEMGARVIRIETLAGDWMRGHYNGLASNRTMAGTEGLSIDLKTDEGQDILSRLLPKVDVVLHNMRPGAPERVGIGIEQVRALSPDAVYAYLGGYGSTGPAQPQARDAPDRRRGRRWSHGADQPRCAPSGQRQHDDGRASFRLPPVGVAPTRSTPDPNTAMLTATAITMALYARQRHGDKQYVETTMIGSNAYVNADDFFDYEGRPERPVIDEEGYGTGRAVQAVPDARRLGVPCVPVRRRVVATVQRPRPTGPS